MLSKCLKNGDVVVMDNASFHKSKKIKDLIEKTGASLIFLPPYSPDLNPIENFWANMKRWIKNRFLLLENSWDAIISYFNEQTSS